VETTTGLDDSERRKLLTLIGLEILSIGPQPIQTALSWLSRYSDGLRAGWPGFYSRQTSSGVHPASYQTGNGVSSPEYGKGIQSSPSRAKAKRWHYASIPPIHLHRITVS
jgi:hypothetical protein